MQQSQGPIGKLEKKDIRIYGAGFSGLVMAYYLEKKGFQCEIFEAKEKPGGKIITQKTPYGICEKAANAIFSSDDVIELLTELDVNYVCAPSKIRKLIYRNNKISSPVKPWELARTLFSLLKKVPTDSNITVHDFFLPLLGEKLCHELLSTALSGIYATDAKKLHFKSLFPDYKQSGRYLGLIKFLRSRRKKNKTKPVSISFENGMEEIIHKLIRKIKAPIHYENSPILNSNYNNIICTDAIDAAKVLQNDHPQISNLLEKINYTALNTLTVFSNTRIDELKNAFGVLIPAKKHEQLIGIVANCEVFPKRVSNKKLHSYTLISRSTKLSQKEILEDFFKVTQLKSENIVHTEGKDWKRAIPRYDLNRSNIIQKIRSEMAKDTCGVILFGNYIDGISLREIVRQAKDFK